jgi:spermidine synthase
VENVTLVDLDPAMTNLPKKFPPLAELNGQAFSNPKLRVVNEDALIWLEQADEQFDVAIVDFPDPNHFALGKLYTKRFYRLLKDRLSPDAAVSVQCTSPLFARQSYWCVVRTMEAAGLSVQPYHVAVPSFGVWGFALAMNHRFDPPNHAPTGLRFLDDAALAAMFQLSADLQPVDVEINRLDNQALVRYYEAEWQRWNH